MSNRSPTAENTPQQVAVIAVRGSGALELCLIRRKDGGAWGIPKGFIDPGDSAERAALKEVVEEAGLTGQLLGGIVGVYDYEKRGAPLTVALYVMQVLEEHDDWEEMTFRERGWFSLEEAAVLLASHPVRPLWDRIRERLVRGTLR